MPDDPRRPEADRASVKRIGGYELLAKIGQGGMGAVYRARQVMLDRVVALKILPPRLAKDADFIQRFVREARAAGKLSHPNVVAGIDVGEADGFHYFAMEFVEGEPVSAILKREGALPEPRVLQIARQVAEGMKHAHEHALIHRDIKPENILMDASGTAKICDLGLARSTDNEDLSVTQAGTSVGTPHYLSPEQARGEKDLDARTDIYALGATLFHMLAGQTLFDGATAALVMTKHISEAPRPLRDVAPNVSEGLAAVVAKCLEKRREDRYASMAELIEDLDHVAAGEEPAALARRGRGARGGRERRGPTAGVSPVTGQRAGAARAPAGEPEEGRKPSVALYAVGAGVLGVGLLVVVLVLASGSGTPKPDETSARVAAEKRKAEDAARLRNEAARLEDERRKLADDRRKAEEAKLEEEKRKLAEERRALEEARAAVEAEAKKKVGLTATKVEPTAAKVEPPPAQPDTKTVQPDARATPPETAAADARAAKAQQALSAVWKETAPLLAQNQFAEAIAVLERKAKDPALADAAELLKQEKTDLEAVVELRRSAVEALRKKVGETVSLKMGRGVMTGKVVEDEKSDGVTLAVDTAKMTLAVGRLHVEDVDRYAPRTGDVGADLRHRGVMYLAAGNVAKAKEYLTKPQTSNPEPYLDRIRALELGEFEAAALKAWEEAERLFAAKDMKAARGAYEAFEREYAKTQTMARQAARLRERYAAIEAALGQLVLDLGGGVRMEFVLVKAGEFEMGAHDGDRVEKPVHRVRISKAYYLGKHEVTQAQYEKLMGNNPSALKGPDLPAEQVSWDDAQAFCKALRGLTGRAARLPTEAEWEYACRAGTTTCFSAGDKDSDLEQVAWFKRNSGGRTHPVGQKQPNAWGLCDMHGNVWEWVQDYYGDTYYAESPPVDPKGPATGEDLVLRGGCAEYDPGACRSAGRLRGKHGQRMGIIGFRVALEPPFAPAARPPTPATPANLQRELALDLGGARMDLVLVPAGEFMMGANDGEPNEKPVHKVTISQPFYIGKYHVTVAQFRAFADATKFQTEAEKVNRGWSAKDGKWQEMNGITWRTPGFKQEDTHPVCVISWNDAQEFCRWATKVTGRHVGLPTEAQWEYAARGPNGPKYPWGDTWDGTRLNHADVNWRKSGATVQEWGASNDNDGFPWTAPVGSYKNASWCGAFDMAGGAWQRCEDFYSDNYYQGSPELDPKGPGAGDSRVLRGGSWNNGPGHGRAAQRHRHDPASRDAGVGFRCTVDCDATETGSRATLPEAPAPTPATPANLQKDLALNLSGGVRMDCVLVTAGEFMMGADDADAKPEEKPVHKVKITKPFYIGKFDVTVAQFRAFADAVKYQTDAEKQNKGATVKDGKWQELSGVHWRKPGFKQEDNHPAVIVTWNDAQEFCKWASKATGRTVRLPTEAEWEYAARGPQTRKYPWGDKWEGLVANVADASLRRTGFSMEWGEIKEDDGYPFTSPVGHYRINLSWCGAYDMAGNVWQWCQDCFNDKYYGESPAVDPQGPAKDGGRVLRGGAWDGGPRRSASRLSCAPGFPVANAGFRAVAEPPKAP